MSFSALNLTPRIGTELHRTTLVGEHSPETEIVGT